MKEISANEFQKEVLDGGKVILDFYSSECPPCDALAPKFESLSSIYGDKVKFLKIFRQQNRELAEQLGVKSSPTLLFFDNGTQLPQTLSGGMKRSEIMHLLNSMITPEEVASIEGRQTKTIEEYDVAILGGGPAGLTAAIYLGQARINTVLIDPALPGGNMSITHKVSNYPGYIDAQPGYMLAHYMGEQAKNSGISTKFAVEITQVDLKKKEIVLDNIETIRAKKIIIATGTSPNPMNIPGEKEYKGKGISYCATCDAKYFVDKEVLVIGGGNSAIEEALYITKFAKKVTIVHRSQTLRANENAIKEVISHPQIELVYQHTPAKIEKQEEKMVLHVTDNLSKEIKHFSADGIFSFIGLRSNVSLFKNTMPTTDQWGYIQTDEDMLTSIPDIYAVGDIRSKKYRQITTAVSDGTIAAMTISKELN